MTICMFNLDEKLSSLMSVYSDVKYSFVCDVPAVAVDQFVMQC